MVITNDIDALLMPPPPPRLPKRQRLESSAAAEVAVAASVSSKGQSTSHDSFSRHRHHQNCTVDLFHDNNNSDGIIAGVVGNECGGGDNNLLAASNSFVDGVEKRLVGTFDDLASMHNNEENCHRDFQPSSSQNYDPSAVSECEGKDDGEESTINDFAKTDKSHPSQGYDAPPINASFRDIIGHGQAKLRLDEALLPLALPPDLADSVLSGIRAAPASILLHGPPGCGKTKLAKAVAGEAQAAFISVGPSDILSKFVGESESAIRGLFREARLRARKMESRCTVVFFDEIDALGRSRVDEGAGVNLNLGLLIQMTGLANMNEEGDEGDGEEDGEEEYDGYCDDNSFACQSTMSTAESEGFGFANERTQARNTGDDNGNKVHTKARVIVVAATNRPEDCDPALLRRFAVRVLVGLPTKKDRKKIIKRLLKDVDHGVTAEQLDELADTTEGWSGSDLESMTREAVMAPVRDCLRAAAILKKKAGKKQQSVESSQADEIKRDDVINSTRETLLNSFRHLRPVTSKDFGDGIAFFLGEQQENMPLNHLSRHAHYDSSSSEDERGEDEKQP
ncbi:AAA ATPase [Skeletonema marinoi]|uniref:AAA ATPase n=1 Tax=Skeletonema marinoi TaxID=267567 RepID=A0AAD8Y3R5_9STRA|nr:AAA ATPase [Skeletonema marinoi]